MKKSLYLLTSLFIVSCGNKVPIPNSSSGTVDSLDTVETVDSVVVYEDDIDFVSNDNYSTQEQDYRQVTFRPVKATISDSQGTFSSSTFDCPNMEVYDKGNYVQLSWGGENIPLYEDNNSPDIYMASQTSPYGVTMKFTAYRSSNSRKIYLVICTTINGNQKSEINFKP